MANPAITKQFYISADAGPHLGLIQTTATWTTYAQGADVLDISGLGIPIEATDIRVVIPAYTNTLKVVVFTPASPPTMANLGILKVFAAGVEVTAGAFADTVKLSIFTANNPPY